MPAAPRNLQREFSKMRLSDAKVSVTDENVDQELEFYENLKRAWFRLEKEADKVRGTIEHGALPFSMRTALLAAIENELSKRAKRIDKTYLGRLHDAMTAKRPQIAIDRLSENSLYDAIMSI
jgi:tRNA 2-selenouridine synthase SelU